MTTTPYLGMPHVAPSQNNKEVTVNDALTQMDKIFCEYVLQDIGQADWSVPLSTLQQIFALGVLNPGAAQPTVTLPVMKRMFMFQNAAETGAVRVALGAASVLVQAKETYLFYADGTADGLHIVANPIPGRPYLMSLYVPNPPVSSELLLRHELPLPVTLAVDLAGSRASALTAPTAETVFTLRRNGAEAGTITFAPGGTTGVFAAATPASCSIGDVLTLEAPPEPDATLAGISITLYATR